MAENGNQAGARVELRVLDRTENKLNLHVLLDGTPIFQSRVDIDRAGARDYFVKALRSAMPDLTDEDAGVVSARLVALSLEPSPEGSKPSDGVTVDTPRPVLVRQRDERADKLLEGMPEDIVAEAAEMLAAPHLADRIVADAEALGVVGERELVLVLYLLGCSRLLERPLAAIVQGPSSSGKSHVVETVARLFPGEAVLHATDLTPQALFYVSEDALVHRFVVGGERRRGDVDELADATRALREMIASRILTKVVTVRHGDTFVAEQITRHGPIAYVETTTVTNLFDEDANRCLLLAADEQPTQTRRVLRFQAERAAGAALPEDERIIQRHHALQRMLRRVRVRTLFARQIEVGVPADRPEARRAFYLALSVVAASALLQQRQRAADGLQHGDRIDATLEDYRLAYGLLQAPLGRALGGDLSRAAENFGRRLHAEFGGREFTAVEAAANDATVKSPSKAREYLRELCDHDVAEIVEQGRGSKPHVFRMKCEPPPGGAAWLPHPDDVDLTDEPPGVQGKGASTPRAPGGATVQQPPIASEHAPATSTSGSIAAPTSQGRQGAAGATPDPWEDEPPRRTTPPQEGRGDKHLPDRLPFGECGRSGVVAPSYQGDDLEREVHGFFPDAEREPNFPDPPLGRREGGAK